MTIIEFYDKTSIENIAGILLCEPERVIFVGHDYKRMEKSRKIYEEILRSRGIMTELTCRSVNRNNLQSIFSYLEDIVKTYQDCVFDLTGGEDLYLVAVGMLMSQYEGEINCHRFNLQNEKLLDCDMDGNICATKSFDISVEENINIYGGEVVRDPSREIYTYDWDFSEDFNRDIEAMWEICKNDARCWNAHIGTLGEIDEIFGEKDSLTLTFDRNTAKETLKYRNKEYNLISGMLQTFQQKQLIFSLSMGDTVSFRFKNEQVKKCLTVAGQILELIVAKNMREIKDERGMPLYNDVKVGVVIDWDGTDERDTVRTINEIDVIAMKGMLPIFISCKNGYFDADELYKLSTVTERFGNEYAKKILVTSELDKMKKTAPYLQARMTDMGIRCIDEVDTITDTQFERELKNIVS